MKEELVFAIDVDEVLRKTLDHMVELYNKHFGKSITRDDVKDFKCEKSFPDVETASGMSASNWFFQEHGTELFLDTEAFPGVKEDIDTLRQYGKVIIITYQKSYKNKIDTLQWLEKNSIECDGICFLKDKTALRADYLIDDNDWNFADSKVKHGILINAPYNENVDVKDMLNISECETIERCNSLHEFVEKFVKANNDIEYMKKQYPTDRWHRYTLKMPITYVDSTVYHHTLEFGNEGDEVIVTRYYIKGTEPRAVVKQTKGWGDISTNANNLPMYLEPIRKKEKQVS